MKPRIYLDHAATSWPKPPGALEACVEYQSQLGAAASRGAYRSSHAADQIVDDARRQIALEIGARHLDSVAFTANGTLALHAAIHGVLHPADLSNTHVVTTAIEHNSVLRPLAQLERTRGLRWTVVPCDGCGRVDPSEIAAAIRPETKLIVVNHGSNVTGAVVDLAAVGEIAQRGRALLLVDAAQTLGYLPLNVDALEIDLLAAPCHKGAGGMLGTGALYVRPGLESQLRSPWIGGTGTRSDTLLETYPWRDSVESGNLNVPSLASLGAGLRWVRTHRDDKPLVEWIDRMIAEIARHPQLRAIVPPERQRQLPVVSLVSDGMDCQEMALALDAALGVETRSGFHCAARIHSHLGTAILGGTLRMSLGHTSTSDDVDAAIEGIRLLASLAGSHSPNNTRGAGSRG